MYYSYNIYRYDNIYREWQLVHNLAISKIEELNIYLGKNHNCLCSYGSEVDHSVYFSEENQIALGYI